jgi:hypothetical protein
MSALNTPWSRRDFFPALRLRCNSCGKAFTLSSGLIMNERADVVATYVAYVPPRSERGQAVTVQLRFGDLYVDDPPEGPTTTYQISAEGGVVEVAGVEDGYEFRRRLRTKFSGFECPHEIVDLIVRDDPHIMPHLVKVGARPIEEEAARQPGQGPPAGEKKAPEEGQGRKP